jgi:hypothetical protein
LASNEPLKHSKRPKWEAEIAETIEWLDRRGISTKRVMREYRRHLTRTVKKRALRRKAMERLYNQLRRGRKAA